MPRQLFPCRRQRDLVKQLKSELETTPVRRRGKGKPTERSHLLWDDEISFPRCFVCTSPSSTSDDSCRFIGCRFIDVQRATDVHAPPKITITFQYDDDSTSPQFRNVFNCRPSHSAVTKQMQTCAQFLVPILLREQHHIKLPNVIKRRREVRYRIVCDICRTSLFAETWLCSTCGRELCSPCKADQLHGLGGPCDMHLQTDFFPITRFDDNELEDAIQSMSALTAMQGSLEECQLIESSSPEEVTTMSCRNINDSAFLRSFARGRPVVVGGLHQLWLGTWQPSYFVERFGSQKVALIDCETNLESQSTVALFFQHFGTSREHRRILKLKDWPPQSNFQEVFPELYTAFVSAVPFPDHARPDGLYNFVSHFAQNGIIPDLGPKMYNAHGDITNHLHQGSTRLHLDVTAAVNIMLYSADLPDGLPGGALWHIFAPEVTSVLREFIRTEPEIAYQGTGDPIHDQNIYFTPKRLQALENKHGIRPFIITQRVGDAIYIPAGCAHQVSNMSDSIKVACDFLIAESLTASSRLIPEFRAQRLIRRWPEDVLQFETSLWYAWKSLSLLYETTCVKDSYDVVGDPDPNCTSHERSATKMDEFLIKDDSNSDGPTFGPPLPPSKEESKRMKRQRHNYRVRTAERPQKPGRDCVCPYCPTSSYFNKTSLVYHLVATHQIAIDPDDARIREYKKLDAGDFCTRLRLLLPPS